MEIKLSRVLKQQSAMDSRGQMGFRGRVLEPLALIRGRRQPLLPLRLLLFSKVSLVVGGRAIGERFSGTF